MPILFLVNKCSLEESLKSDKYLPENTLINEITKSIFTF